MVQENKKDYHKKKKSDNVYATAQKIGNKPPQALDVEEAVIGALLVDGEGFAFPFRYLHHPTN